MLDAIQTEDSLFKVVSAALGGSKTSDKPKNFGEDPKNANDLAARMKRVFG